MKRIFIDMDGVLAKWGVNTPFEKVKEEGYFASLDVYENMQKAIKLMIKEGLDVYILSSILKDNHSAYDKNCWLDEYLPEISLEKRFFVPHNRRKDEYIECQTDPGDSFTDILIDDYSKNLHNWNKSGKIGIKAINGINGNNGTWDGYRISIFDEPEQIFKSVKEITDDNVGYYKLCC